MNHSIKLNLLKLSGTAVRELTGQSGAKKSCLIIPIEDNSIFVTEKGAYIDFTAIESDKMKEASHFVKQSLPRAKYDAMSDDQRKAMPILGNMQPIARRVVDSVNASEYPEEMPGLSDLPF
ncbi:MAG: hypothetical protein ACRCZM_11840 [Bacteroidales bacterium]